MRFWHLSHLTKWKRYSWPNRKRLRLALLKTGQLELCLMKNSPWWSLPNNQIMQKYSFIFNFIIFNELRFFVIFFRKISHESQPNSFTSRGNDINKKLLKERRRQRQRQKLIGLMSKTTALHLDHAFLVFFYALHDYDVKPPDASSWCNVLWRRWTYDHEFSFLFLFWTWIEALRIQLQDANSFFSDLFTAVVDVIA